MNHQQTQQQQQTQHHHGGIVKITTDLDDFIQLSQACINPIFSTRTTTANKTTTTEAVTTTDNNTTTSSVGSITIIPKKKKKRMAVVVQSQSQQQSQQNYEQQQSQEESNVVPLNHQLKRMNQKEETIATKITTTVSTTIEKNTNNNNNKKKDDDVVKAAITDCLACSGCITTAESVLLEEQRALQVLRQVMNHTFHNKYTTSISSSQTSTEEISIVKPTPETKLQENTTTTTTGTTTTSLSSSFVVPDSFFDDCIIVMTISPASWADLCRHLHLVENHDDSIHKNDDDTLHRIYEKRYRQLTTVLYEIFHIQIVLDGNVPLKVSLETAAQHFCTMYTKYHDHAVTTTNDDDANSENDFIKKLQSYPSIAISSTQTQYYLPDGTTHIMDTSGNKTNTTTTVQLQKNQPSGQLLLPILSSSCPATVCLIEKSIPKAVSHLHSVKSSMSIAGSIFQHYLSTHSNMNMNTNDNNMNNYNNKNHDESCTTHNNNNGKDTTDYHHHHDQPNQTKNQQILHIALMPCHDKKLEAARNDYKNMVHKQNDVDYVITTTECLQLLQEAVLERYHNNNNNNNHRKKTNRTSEKRMDDEAVAVAVEESDDDDDQIMTTSRKNLTPPKFDLDSPSLFVRHFLLSQPLSNILEWDPTTTTTTTTNNDTKTIEHFFDSIIRQQQDYNEQHKVRQFTPTLITLPISHPDKNNNKNKMKRSHNEKEDNSVVVEPITTTTPQSIASTASPNLRMNDDTTTSFFLYGSGGYADYIFRYAAKTLFGYNVMMSPTTATSTIWKPVSTINSTAVIVNNRRTIPTTATITSSTTKSTSIVVGGGSSGRTTMSARIAKQRQKKKEYYEAVLYRHEGGSSSSTVPYYYYSMNPDGEDDVENVATTSTTTANVLNCGTKKVGIPVLRFAIAYGMPLLQSVFEPFQEKTSDHDGGDGSNGNNRSCNYDYVEAMACPSGCVNGGGQIRLVPTSATSTTSSMSVTTAASTVDGNHTADPTTISVIGTTATNNPNFILTSRETPVETRKRVQMTQNIIKIQHSPVIHIGDDKSNHLRSTSSSSNSNSNEESFGKEVSNECGRGTNCGEKKDHSDDDDRCCCCVRTKIKDIIDMHTQYHIVPVMQYNTGAAAGIKVQDAQW